MSATAEQAGRMLALVPWLLERPGASVEEAAAAFDVDPETLVVEVQALAFCGLPGLRGGDLFEVDLVGDRIIVTMADELRRPLRLLPEEALRLVLVAGAAEAAIGGSLPALTGALQTLRRAAGVPAGVEVGLEETAALTPLRRALDEDVVVRLRYRGRGQERATRRTVEPWSLVAHRGRWYLQGRDVDRDAQRTFRLDRIEHVEITSQAVTGHPPVGPLPLPAYVPGEDDVRVELSLAPAARWIVEHLDPDEVVVADDGSARVTLTTDAPRYVLGLVASTRGAGEVVAPDHLRRRLAEAARAASSDSVHPG